MQTPDGLKAIATALPRLRASATRKLTPRVLIGLPDKPSPVQSQKVGLFDRLEKWADGLAASRTQGNVSAAGGSGLGVTVGDQDVVVHDKASGTGSGVRGQQRPANTSTDEMNSTSSGSRSQPREPELQGKEGMLPGVDGGLPSPSPARISPDRPADGTKRVLNGGRIGSDVSANDGAVVEWRQEADNGAAVVFQLLMQRWELRPWVVVPRTLVATKEQVPKSYFEAPSPRSLLNAYVSKSHEAQPISLRSPVFTFSGPSARHVGEYVGFLTCVILAAAGCRASPKKPAVSTALLCHT